MQQKTLSKLGLIGIAVIIGQQFLLTKKAKKIMATQQEAAQQLAAFNTQLGKVNGEIQTKLQTLIDAAGQSDTVSPELQAAIDDLAPTIQQLDDIVPDAPTEEQTTSEDVTAG